MSFESRYQKLNAEQKLAVDTIEGPVMVVAGPGTGKTELLGLRVANILRQSDALSSAILCLTFTESGASNMRERLVGLIGAEAYKVAIHTFHSFAMDIIARFREDFYEARQMQVPDEIRQIETIGQILEALPFSDALATKGHDGTYFYLKSVRDRIGKLKKAGITPSEFEQILYANSQTYEALEAILIPAFSARIVKATRELVPGLISQIKALPMARMPISHSSLLNYQELLASSLEHAYGEALAENNTKALTAWKEEWLKKDPDSGELQLKDRRQWERNLSLAQVYGQYQRLMEAAGFIDFDDMIMDLIQALIKKPGLLAELQEKYQYILVDEFQDTNEAQMRIVNLLADNPVNEGRPNIMVVGDDDQSIFKFQGAEINNVLQFQKQYPATKFITLNKNYRSTAAIVDFSQLIIAQGQDRLTKRIEAIKKTLEAANPEIASGQISAHSFDTAAHEYAYIIAEIKSKLRDGTKPNEIAVIARNHRQLELVARQLEAAQIAAQYERQRDVLEEPHIKELITLAKLVCSLTTEQIHYQQELLVEALAADFWGIERKVIWQLAIEADERRKNGKSGRWLDAMLESDDQRLKELATWLLDVAARAQIEPLNNLIDELIGPEQKSEKFSSPFRQFYFHKDSYQENPQKYLQFLGSLNTFINKVRSFVAKLETPKLADLVECVNLHEKHQLAITDTSPSLSGNQAITLISAHKAKGLEFDTVFVINCQESIWSKAQGHDLIAFPKNLAIDPSGETIDDYLRLFFVALTRAKRHLYLTSYTHNDNGKASLRLPFLEALQVESFAHDIAREHKQIDITATIKSLESSLFGVGKINIDEQSILQPLLDKYILSVTHLNTFLNITRGGPQTFFEQNLLRFPQAKTALASYGTAMHATMEAIYSHLKKTGVVPTLNQAKEFYQEKLTKENLPAQVLEQYLDKGNETLRVYLLTASKHLDPSHLIEVDFRMQQVMIGSTQITGKIDKVVPQEEDKAWEVYDFKTGNPARDWKGKDEKEKIKLHGYKRQLVFYKLLVESSRDYNNYQVKLGSLEFLNPTKAGEIVVLPYQITDTDVERMKKLIVAVDKKIRSLDFPDVSSYEESLTGIMQFEDDLINGKI